MEIKDVKVGMFVKLSIDLKTKYQVVEIIPQTKIITIRKYGNGDMGSVKASDIELW